MTTAALRAQLIVDEGLRLKPYTDTRGRLTIGVGRNLTDVGISQDEAMLLLDHDIEATVSTLARRWPPFLTLDPVRQNVLANMAFNLGVSGLMLFTHMLAACAQQNYPQAALEMRNSQWAKQVGARAERLARQMATGEV